MKISIIFTADSYYFETEVPSKEEIRYRNLSKIVYKHGGLDKWIRFKIKNFSYYPPTTVRFFKLNHTAAGIPKKEFDKQITKIKDMINCFNMQLTDNRKCGNITNETVSLKEQ